MYRRLRKNRVPIIRDYMTPSPQVISADASIQAAQQLMQRENIRHLPVDMNAELVGFVSDGVLKSAALSQWGDKFQVRDVMITTDVISSETSLDEVICGMLTNRNDAVIVKESNGSIVGIFTTTDALRALHDTLTERSRKSVVGFARMRHAS